MKNSVFKGKMINFIFFIIVSTLPILLIYASKYSIFGLASITFDALILLSIIVFVFVTIWSIINFFIKLRTKFFITSVIQLTISIITTSLLFLTIYMNIPYSYDKEFSIRYTKLQAAVEYVQSSEKNSLTDEEYKLVSLPLKYRYLSKGGEVWYQQKNKIVTIFFITSNDFLYESYYGYVYRSNESEPTDYEYDGNFIGRKIRLNEKWFWKGQ